jgi:hypothetical protein
MIRTTLITLLAGFAVALALTLTGPGSAGALQAHTTPPGSSSNPDGTSGSPVNTIAPTINHSGTVSVGTKLSCGEGTWANDPTSYRERWRANKRLVHTGANYTVVKADQGYRLSCYVAATNAQGTGTAVLAGSVTVKR